MICRILGIAIVLSLAVSASSEAQPGKLPQKKIVFQQLPGKLSLSQSSINCVLQDRDGFLWIGTWSGLIRYDGYSTQIFHSDDGPDQIRSNKITAIHEDRSGLLWIGTHMGGLFRYDKNTNKFVHFEHRPADKASLSNNNIWSIKEDRRGNLWVGTEYGLNVLKPGTTSFDKFFHHDHDSTSLSHNFVTDIFLASSGDLWISTSHGLNRLIRHGDGHGFAFEKYLYPEDPDNGSLHNYIYQVGELVIHNQSSIWFSTKKGLKKLQDKKLRNFMVADEDESAGSNFFRSLLTVSDGDPYLLVGSETGLNFFDPVSNTFIRYLSNSDQKVNLSHNTITALYMDQGGVLWVGTKKGLNKYDTYANDFESYATSFFDPTKSIITGIANTVDATCPTCADGDIKRGYWISTIGGGLYRFSNGRFQRYTLAGAGDDNFADFIQTLYADGKGSVWIGTAGSGVYRFREKDISPNSTVIARFDHYDLRTSPALSDDHIMAMEEDRDGNLWVGTWSGGLNKITPEGNVEVPAEPLLKQAPLVAMHADHSGILWIGTRGDGLYQFNTVDQHARQYLHNDEDTHSLTNNFINAVFEDHSGMLWVGTEDGLNALDRRAERFTEFKMAETRGNDVVVSILEDDGGKLWIAHWDGLTVLDPADSTFVQHYDHHDRIQGGFFYNNVCFKDREGRLVFGGSDGLNIIDPSALVQHPLQPKVALSSFRIFNKPVSFGEEHNGRVLLDKPLAAMQTVVLKHFENSFSFEFTALDFAGPEKTRYAFMLEGFDKSWNYSNADRRFANYTNLGAGHYVFKVKATNTDGDWNDAISQVFLEIRPPWWKTTWAGIVYALILLGVLYLFRKFILVRANLIHDLKLERVQRENMEKLNQAKLRFFTHISHEFRTPLTLIIGPIQNLLESVEAGKLIRDQLMVVNSNAQRLLRLVNQLLDFRKAESGNMTLEAAEGNLVRFIREIKLSFDGLAEKMRIDFGCKTSANTIKLWFDRDLFEKIFFNLLSNAFKHTPEGGKISIIIQEGLNDVSVIIEDNGRGIRREHIESVFQSFFSYDEDRHHASTGIGLALAKTLVEMHHGCIDVESQVNEFTRFTVKVPKGFAHFNASELSLERRDSDNIEKYPALESSRVQLASPDSPERTSPEPAGRLLIVEDNEEIRDYIQSVFEHDYHLLVAGDGKSGLELALKESPDLIISDVMMPVMDGITFCKVIKSNVRTSHIPVILLTARTSLIFKVEGLENGADEYLTKPFSPKVLQLKVRNLIALRKVMQKLFQDSQVLTIEPRRVVLTSADEQFVKSVLESVEKNMGNADYAVDDLGRDAGMSRTQLYRKLKALTGQSANEFIRTLRLKRAAQLLEQDELTVAEVTYEVGFTDLQHFRECFKKLFGVTPSEYAQRAVDGVDRYPADI
ncbi:MAG TPA: two-component regulator propeller domain-containing protein [Ohtaekwangia sp.]|nr:two-component regulator propeller domain-containing protein [Ohtaekwangia sp.]